MNGSGAVVWLDGPRARSARLEAVELLRSLGRPAAAVDEEDETSARLARAGVVTLRLGQPRASELGQLRRASIRAHVLTDGGAGPTLNARSVLAAVDHGLEVAIRPIFVVGMGRSGTSWVTDLLGGHPRVCALFETELFFDERLSFLADAGSFDPDRSIPLMGLRRGTGLLVDQETAVTEIRALLVRWLSRAVGDEHAWLVEKTPALKNLEAMAALFPDARFVCVMRDLRDVMVSFADARRSWLGNTSYARLVIDIPRDWRDGWAAIERVRSLAPVHVIRYEALHAAPEREVKQLFEFCGIPCDHRMIREIVAANRFELHPDTGPLRFRRGGRVGDWRTQLGWVDRQIALAVAGRAMLAQGYLATPTPAMLLGDALRAVRRSRRHRREVR